MKFEEVKFSWISRAFNEHEDIMAKQAHIVDKSFLFHYYVPSVLSNSLHKDYVSSLS